jgi:hypothetical protein
MSLDTQTMEQLEAASFRRLIVHLQNHTEVQNIDLMILADFCRNCLSKWMVSSADDLGVDFDYDQAREHVYGMPYSEWKGLHQQPATPEQMAAFQARQDAKQKS